MNPISDEEIAQFIKLLQNAQAPGEELHAEPVDGPFMISDANAAARQLSEYLRKLHAEDMQSHNANNGWLQQIDKNVKSLEDTVVKTAYGSAIAIFLISVFLMLVLKSGG